MNGGATSAPPFIVSAFRLVLHPTPDRHSPPEMCKALTVPHNSPVETRRE